MTTLPQGSVVHFLHNSASISGGAIHADAATSTQSLVQALELQYTFGASQQLCFLQMPPDLTVHMGIPQSPPNGSAVRHNAVITDAFEVNWVVTLLMFFLFPALKFAIFFR